MRNKGFTLVELIATLTIISIISLIAIPSVNKAIVSSQDEVYVSDAKIMISNARYYYSLKDKYDNLFTINSNCYVISLSKMKVTIYEASNGKYDSDNTLVKICLENDAINYYVKTKYIKSNQTKGIYDKDSDDGYVLEKDLSKKYVINY